MATIYTTGPIKDNLDLISPDGKKLEISFSFTPSGALTKKVREMQIAMAKAVQQPGEDANSVVGKVVVDLFDMIFGQDNTARMMEFYAGRYEAMAVDILPYIRDTVIPACQKYVRGAQKKAKAGWRR